jgi:hypothetical protein
MKNDMRNSVVVLTFLVVATAAGAFVPSAFAAKAFVAVTGQTTVYAEGDDGDVQAGVPFPGRRFIDEGDGTVMDRLTGLTWLQDASCFGPRNWYETLSAVNALRDAQCALTDGSAAGDWRLPNIKELQSLIDYGQLSPALPPGHPFVNVQPVPYWSSTTSAGFPNSAWTIPLDRGGSSFDDSKTNEHYAWPVRGGRR